MTDPVRPARIVVIGPSGNGKSTLAALLAERLGWRFVEGDDHHPPANVAKMARGEPLDDADRAPFLASIAAELARAPDAVVACSALRRDYREVLAASGPVLFVLPQVPADVLRRRIAARHDHFMPASLVDSQLAALELPEGDEPALVLDGERPAADLADSVTAYLESLPAGD